MGTTLLLLLPAVIAAVTFMLATAFLIARCRRRARMSARLTSIAQLRLPGGTFSHRRLLAAGESTCGESTGEPVQVRSLRAHVRTLEAALEQEQHRALLQRQDASTAEELVAYQRRVDATIRAMSRQAEGDEAERLLARVAAAVERLAAPEGFARPTLSPAGSIAVLGRPAGIMQLHSVGAPQTVSQTAQQPQHPPMPAVDETVEMVPPTIDPVPAPVEPEVVLPVPVMAQSEENRRGRRRFRTRAA